MRYLPLNDNDRRAMLDVVGVDTVDDLFTDVPKKARLSDLIDLPTHKSEAEIERYMAGLSSRSMAASSVPFFCGAGAYKHHIPATVDHLIQRSEFLTAYTPYQPEISQGTLQTLFEFQTQVACLTGMEVANASMYDGSTACAEAVVMAHRVARGKKKKAVLASGLHPHYAASTKTTAKFLDIDIVEEACTPGQDCAAIDQIDDNTACVVVQSPMCLVRSWIWSLLPRRPMQKGHCSSRCLPNRLRLARSRARRAGRRHCGRRRSGHWCRA